MFVLVEGLTIFSRVGVVFFVIRNVIDTLDTLMIIIFGVIGGLSIGVGDVEM